MKYAEPRPYADPEKAARRIIEIASTIEPVQEGRIHVEKINGPFLYQDKSSPTEYGVGLKLCIDRGWLRCTKAARPSASPPLAPICSLKSKDETVRRRSRGGPLAGTFPRFAP